MKQDYLDIKKVYNPDTHSVKDSIIYVVPEFNQIVKDYDNNILYTVIDIDPITWKTKLIPYSETPFLDAFLIKWNDFFQLVIFQGKFSGIYGIITPHEHASKLRSLIHDGGDYDDNDTVILAEKLFVRDDSHYPGATGNNIQTVLSKIDKKLQSIEVTKIYHYVGIYLDNIEKKGIK